MNLFEVNGRLSELIEMMLEPDEQDLNDLGRFGMDAMTQKRLRVKKLHKPKKTKNLRRPMRTHLPYGLR